MILLVVISLILQSVACFKVIKDGRISNILAISMVFFIILWYVTPGFIIVFYEYNDIVSSLYNDISEDDLIIAYFLESLTLFIIIITFLKILKHWSKKSGSDSFKLSNRRDFLLFLVISYAVLLIYKFNYSSFNYLINNTASLYDQKANYAFVDVIGQFLFSATAFSISICYL